MARATNRLTARGVATMTTPARHADGNGLYLKITLLGAKSWTLIYRYGGKRCGSGHCEGKCTMANWLALVAQNPSVLDRPQSHQGGYASLSVTDALKFIEIVRPPLRHLHPFIPVLASMIGSTDRPAIVMR